MREDLDAFFSGLDITQAVFVEDGKERRVTGYFDNAFFDTSVGQVVLNTTQPRFECKESDSRGVVRGMDFCVRGTTYTVLETQAEGTGTTTILLAHK